MSLTRTTIPDDRSTMTDKPIDLFVCVHNAGRSQMAAGYLQALACDRVEVLIAELLPAGANSAEQSSPKV